MHQNHRAKSVPQLLEDFAGGGIGQFFGLKVEQARDDLEVIFHPMMDLAQQGVFFPHAGSQLLCRMAALANIAHRAHVAQHVAAVIGFGARVAGHPYFGFVRVLKTKLERKKLIGGDRSVPCKFHQGLIFGVHQLGPRVTQHGCGVTARNLFELLVDVGEGLIRIHAEDTGGRDLGQRAKEGFFFPGLQLGFFALGDVGADGDKLIRLPLGIGERHDGGIDPIRLAVASKVLDFTAPYLAVGQLASNFPPG